MKKILKERQQPSPLTPVSVGSNNTSGTNHNNNLLGQAVGLASFGLNQAITSPTLESFK